MQDPEQTQDPLRIEPEVPAQALPTLTVSGVVLSRAQMIEALRVSIPNISDVSMLPDGQHFTVMFGTDGSTKSP